MFRRLIGWFEETTNRFVKICGDFRGKERENKWFKMNQEKKKSVGEKERKITGMGKRGTELCFSDRRREDKE